MSRARLATLLFVPAVVVVLFVGLTRATNDDPDADRGRMRNGEGVGATSVPIAGVGGDLTGDEPLLAGVAETVTVNESDDCRALVRDDPSPSCAALTVGETEVVWAVEQHGDDPPVASVFRRASATSWERVLSADGANRRGFSVVNVRTDDITGDGAAEMIFGFHNEDQLGVDIVDPVAGEVLAHLDLPGGHVLVGGGILITWTVDGDEWTRQELTLRDGEVQVVLSETVQGPAEGNL